jgi:hypothetical protein
VSRTGDLRLFGQHRLLCGDSTVATDDTNQNTRRIGWRIPDRREIGIHMPYLVLMALLRCNRR